VIPAPRLFWLLTLLFLLGITAAVLPGLDLAWQAALAVLVLTTLVDGVRLRLISTPMVQRHLAASLPVGVETTVGLNLQNPGKQTLLLDVFDHHPRDMKSQQLPQRVRLPGQAQLEIHYRLTPLERGPRTFTAVQMHLYSPWQLWRSNRRVVHEETVRVYPNFAPVAKYTLLATDNRLSQMGIKRVRRRGEGQDFHQLREYRQGDSLRQIDWKASSRVRKLISKEYQEERDQEIIFMLDCGNRMMSQDDALSHFDHSLNAALLLAYVALRQGDAIGFANFGGEQRWLPPFKGPAMIHRLLNTLYDLQPTTRVPDYSEAATQLMLRQKKRALVVLITNLRDEDPGDLLPAIRLLRQRHLVLVASMRELALDNELKLPVKDFDQALRHAATRHYLNQRDEVMENLVRHDALYLDVPPQELSVALVNHYLDIKSSGML
jgi:uncharacterized protein (DUF58 family)